MTLKGHTEFQMNRNDICYEFKLMGKQQLATKKKKKKLVQIPSQSLSTPTERGFHSFEPNQRWKRTGLGVISAESKRIPCHYPGSKMPPVVNFFNSAVLAVLTNGSRRLYPRNDYLQIFCYFETGVLDQAGLESTEFFQLSLFGICNSKVECHHTQLAGGQF